MKGAVLTAVAVDGVHFTCVMDLHDSAFITQHDDVRV